MILSEFFRKYPDEEACRSAFKQIRDQQGVVCKKCQGTQHFWKADKWQYECKSCRFRTTLRSGTVMEGSKLPYRYWLTAMALLTSTKKSFSALELQRQLGHKRYEPIWAMLHKLRAAMGKRDKKYELKEYIEMDEGFFESANGKGAGDDEGTVKRGRGSQRQSKVLVAIESVPVEKEKKKKEHKHKPDRQCGYLKMIVMDDLSAVGIDYEVRNNINKGSVVMTDGYKGYSKLKDSIKQHRVTICKDKKEVGKAFPWVHTAISNAKKICLGIHHSIKGMYMQNYLNEFCYKFNRKYFGDKLFDRLLIASVSDTWY